MYRFDLKDTVDERYDVVVSSDTVRLHSSDTAVADVTFQCEKATYVLFLTGRLPLARSVRRRLMSFDGDEGLASRFTEYFKQNQ